MKTLDEIIDQFKPSKEWMDRPSPRPTEDDVDFGQQAKLTIDTFR